MKKIDKSRSRFTVRKAKTGLGLFANENIKKGEFILEYTGKKIPTALADTLKSRYLFEIDSEWTIDGRARSNLARYINHSCDPNTEAEVKDGRILIHSVRQIRTGEEVTIDYDTEYFDEFIRPTGCRCRKCNSPDDTWHPQSPDVSLRV
jgi:hypothetical protein